MARMRVGPLPRDKASGIATLVIVRVVSPPPAESKYLLLLGRHSSSSDLVESGVSNLVGFELRSSVNHLRQDLGHFCVTPAIVVVGVLLGVPQAQTESLGSTRDNERDFIPKPTLFSKQRDDVLFQPLGKLERAVGFNFMDTRRAYIYVSLVVMAKGELQIIVCS